VARDVLSGLVSRAAARSVYGVVLVDGALTVDEAATAAQRQAVG
jgi:hypothetical protein